MKGGRRSRPVPGPLWKHTGTKNAVVAPESLLHKPIVDEIRVSRPFFGQHCDFLTICR